MDKLPELYTEYDPDNDFNGAVGPAIADKILKKHKDIQRLAFEISLAKLKKTIDEKLHSK